MATLAITPADSPPASLSGQEREDAASFALEQLKSLVLNATDEKVRLGAIHEMGIILALGANARAPAATKATQTNVFNLPATAPEATQKLLERFSTNAAVVAPQNDDEDVIEAAVHEAAEIIND